ncbi:MAG: hypothetical protein R2701_08870 [Acidimicrobiales bacterium]|nr:hypothetical protein [Acidimicrobiales bacterium]
MNAGLPPSTPALRSRRRPHPARKARRTAAAVSAGAFLTITGALAVNQATSVTGSAAAATSTESTSSASTSTGSTDSGSTSSADTTSSSSDWSATSSSTRSSTNVSTSGSTSSHGS